MKKQRNNICKPVKPQNLMPLCVNNFVYETEADKIMEKMYFRRDFAMYLVVNGSGVFKNEFCEKSIKLGTVFFSFAGEGFRIDSIDSLHYIYVSFSGDRADAIFTRLGINHYNCVFDGHEGLVSFWKTSIEKANENNIDLISEGVLLYTFSELSPTTENGSQYLLGSILECIESNFTDPAFSLSACAEDLGYNHKYISRVFKDEMGMTFSEYVKNMRMRHAVFLMEQGITSIKNVSIMCGYRDPLYFSNVFKQTTGKTPSEYTSKRDVE
jgi:AraC-like DNA-binding protein